MVAPAAPLVVGGVRVLTALGRNAAGRVGLRFTRGVVAHTGGQAARRGCYRLLPKAYAQLDKTEKWVADQAVELAVRIAADIAQQGIEVYVSEEEIEGVAHRTAIDLRQALINGIESRAMSIGYDFCFGEIDRQGNLVVGLDLIKQMILAGIGEILNDSVATT